MHNIYHKVALQEEQKKLRRDFFKSLEKIISNSAYVKKMRKNKRGSFLSEGKKGVKRVKIKELRMTFIPRFIIFCNRVIIIIRIRIRRRTCYFR